MKSAQFVVAATFALVAVVSAQNPVVQHPELASNSVAAPKATSSVNPAGKPAAKVDQAHAKDANGSDKKPAATHPAVPNDKQNKNAKDANKDKKNAKQAKDNIAAPDANAASSQIAISGALVGAVAVIGAFI
ncbi:hypothetical protein LPJ73_001269 [Coemansia sp. RSA 2703]|nr:hypothetical protein LPJ73_001269 [Coemansia sp. RSA 2703]KAJ2373570.1 hypothetical protein IW150_003554 [Coemansia sp. RSA 2607]KAJ2396021.1 hypothetical protein GGI05_001315 [Coemansia sp. RSA 2603]